MAKKISSSVGKGGKNLAATQSVQTKQRAMTELTRQGMTFVGARQVLDAEPLSNPSDRAVLAEIAEWIGEPGGGLNSRRTRSRADAVGAFRDATKHPSK
ncbi:MAG: hypothetical protein AAFP87_20345 [Pseudomonadota bacterium]